MANYYVPLAQQTPGQGINLEPLNAALDSIQQQNSQNRAYAFQQKQFDATQQQRQFENARATKQDENAEIKMFGDRAKAFSQLAPDDPVRQNWGKLVQARHPNAANLDPRYLDPIEGPKLVMAEAGEYLDPLEKKTREAQLGLIQAQTNAANRKADPYDIKEVNGTLVRVPKSGGDAEVVYRSGPDQTRAPQGYRFAHDGQTLVPIPGGPGDKLTEGESKDALFAERLLRSNASVDKLMNIDENGKIRGYDPTKNINAYIPDSGLVANLVNSDNWKNYQQAAREGLASILRKDTGAAVTPEEFKLYFPTYYPQPGDDPATVLQKKLARERFGSGLRGASSRAFDRMYPNYEPSVPSPQGGNGGVAKPMSPAERDALPPGTQYMAPDGSLRVKP